MPLSTLQFWDLARAKGKQAARPELLDDAVLTLVLAAEAMTLLFEAEDFGRLERPTILQQLAQSFCQERRLISTGKRETL